MKRVKFGIQLPVWNPTYYPKPRQNPHGTIWYKIPELDPKIMNQTAIEAEKLNYDSIWVIDHLSKMPGNQRLECWTTITWLAAQTKKIHTL